MLPSPALTKAQVKVAEREFRCLYRSLLRATTYLPDSQARTYVRELVTKRFRQNGKKQPAPHIIKNQIKKAKSTYRMLERANCGKVEDLKSVLMRVYGRTGPRKRLLLQDLLRKDEDEVPKNDEALQELIRNPSGKQATDYEPGSKFFQFLRSQQANQPLDYQSPIKQLQPKIPATNIWLRPIPLKAQTGLRQRWWAMTLDKIAPPIPLAEWQRLEGFATGKLLLEEVPVRRTAAQFAPREPKWKHDAGSVLKFLNSTTKEDQQAGKIGWLDGSEEKYRFVGREFAKFDQEKGLCIGEGAKQDPAHIAHVPMGKRAMRRLYASIWNMTPTMEHDKISKQWNVRWGGQRSAAHNGEVSKPSQAHKEFFEGVEGSNFAPPIVRRRSVR